MIAAYEDGDIATRQHNMAIKKGMLGVADFMKLHVLNDELRNRFSKTRWTILYLDINQKITQILAHKNRFNHNHHLECIDSICIPEAFDTPPTVTPTVTTKETTNQNLTDEFPETSYRRYEKKIKQSIIKINSQKQKE